ncbi:MAG TPA: GNAT family N-acetyltransferase [Acetobacteraceae bacterium]|nr:GNAT family N-acetyltransferase [Acetobacteraceae bacterium]
MIRVLGRSDAAGFRALRLEALRQCPAAFGSSYETEQLVTEAGFADRIPDHPPDAIFGAFPDGDAGGLSGMLGFRVHANPKERHKAMLWGMYLRPAIRRRGIATALLQRAIGHAATIAGLEIIQLSVVTEMQSARALYDQAGFVVYGIERRALRLAPDDYRDEELRALDLLRDPAVRHSG